MFGIVMAIGAGVIAGIIGFLPLLFSLKKAMRPPYGAHIGLGVLLVGASFVTLAGEIVICRTVAPQYLVQFSLGLITTFFVSLACSMLYAKKNGFYS